MKKSVLCKRTYEVRGKDGLVATVLLRDLVRKGKGRYQITVEFQYGDIVREYHQIGSDSLQALEAGLLLMRKLITLLHEDESSLFLDGKPSFSVF